MRELVTFAFFCLLLAFACYDFARHTVILMIRWAVANIAISE